MSRTLVFGGVRSGKSAHAESLTAARGKEGIDIATADAGDTGMQARIARHREERSPHWTTVAARCERVAWAAAGLTLMFKGGPC
jgi:adenosylcobinamide kinase/adenosylcobinamide-phosphate guanylyltransferase